MTAIGGTPRKAPRPTQPQWVVQRAPSTNEFLLLSRDDKDVLFLSWIGDPNAATKFDSKFAAKARTRDFDDIPPSRVFKPLEAHHG